MNDKKFLDDKGRLIGREVNGVMLDGKGKVVARYIESSNRTVDGQGRVVSIGDQRLRQLGEQSS